MGSKKVVNNEGVADAAIRDQFSSSKIPPRFNPFVDDPISLKELLARESAHTLGEKRTGTVELVHDALKNLPEDEQTMLRGLFFEQRTVIDIANSIGIKPHAARLLRKRALDNFRYHVSDLSKERDVEEPVDKKCPLCTHKDATWVNLVCYIWIDVNGFSIKGFTKHIRKTFGPDLAKKISRRKKIVKDHLTKHLELTTEQREEVDSSDLQAGKKVTMSVTVTPEQYLIINKLSKAFNLSQTAVVQESLILGLPLYRTTLELTRSMQRLTLRIGAYTIKDMFANLPE